MFPPEMQMGILVNELQAISLAPREFERIQNFKIHIAHRDICVNIVNKHDYLTFIPLHASETINPGLSFKLELGISQLVFIRFRKLPRS